MEDRDCHPIIKPFIPASRARWGKIAGWIAAVSNLLFFFISLPIQSESEDEEEAVVNNA